MNEIYINSIDSNKGLPVEQVHKLSHDSLGRFWLATSSGLVCYDGTRIEVYDKRDGLECVGLRTVSADFENEIWIGTDQGFEILTLKGEKIDHHLNFEWQYGIAECICPYHSDVLIGTSNGFLHLSREDNTFFLKHFIDIGFVRGITVSGSRIIAFSNLHGLLEIKETSYVKLDLDLHDDEEIRCFEETADNYILIGTNLGLITLDIESMITRRPIRSGLKTAIEHIKTHGPDWWLVSGKEMYRVSAGLNNVSVSEILNFESKINDLFIDDLENIWVATNNSGLKKVSFLRQVIKKIDYGNEGPVYAIKKRSNGAITICSENMVTNLVQGDDLNWTTHAIPIDPAGILWDAQEDYINNDKTWLAGQNGTFLLEADEGFSKYSSEEGYTNNPNRSFEVIDGTLFLGTISGLYKIESDRVIEIKRPNNESFGYVYTLLKASNNVLYIGTLGQGLFTLDNGVVKGLDTYPLSNSGNTYALAENSLGEIAILQNSELILSTDSNLEIIYSEDPMAGWSLLWINNEQLVIGSNYGLNIIDRKDKQSGYKVNLLFGPKDWQFTCSRSLQTLAQGVLLCGLNGGLYEVNLKLLQSYRVLPELIVYDIKWENGEPDHDGVKFIIKDGKWTLGVQVFIPWFVDEEQLYYEYKMIGFDNNWSDRDQTGNIRYNSLPPGKYKLKVRGFTPFTGYGEETEIMEIQVTTPWWFPILFPVYNSAKNRFDRWFNSASRNRELVQKYQELQIEIDNKKRAETRLLEQQHELELLLENYKITEQKLNTSNLELRNLSSGLQNMIEDERTKISREVHDVLGQKLTLLKLEASLLNKKYKQTDTQVVEKTNSMIDVINDTIGSVRKISTDLRPSILDDLGLANAIEWRLNMFEKVTKISTDLNIQDGDESLPPEIVTAVYRVFEESLTNIIRHAKAKNVKVDYIRNDENVELRVSDDGVGIDHEKLENSNRLGVLGMKERIIILEGTFEIKNQNPSGTTIRAIIPIQNEKNSYSR
ncbi:MAG: hypothetical protein KJO00_07975 [Bacteroidia bacterium]|nr:hypothetical protein [Bacteroidia bacterium]